MKSSSLISAFLAIIGLVAAQPQLSGYDYCQTLLMVTDTTLLNTTIYYQFCYSIRAPNIFFGAVCEIDGWCGVGVSTTGYMVGPVGNEPSDVYVGFRNSSNLPQVGDFIIRGRNTPSQCVALPGVCIDGSNSVQNPNGQCTNNAANVNVTKVNIANVNYTITEFSRPLAASDACDLAITPGVQVYILAAMGSVGAGNYPASILKHTYHSGALVPVTFNNPITSGLITTGAAGPQVTTDAVTTDAVTTGVSVTTGLAPVTTAQAPVTTGLAPVTTAQAPVTTGLAPVTTGAQPELTTGQTTTGQDASDSSAVILGVGVVTAIALTF